MADPITDRRSLSVKAAPYARRHGSGGSGTISTSAKSLPTSTKSLPKPTIVIDDSLVAIDELSQGTIHKPRGRYFLGIFELF